MKTLALALVMAWSLPVLAQPRTPPISNRDVVTRIQPVFPESEKFKGGARKFQVKLELIIRPDGIVQDARVLESAGDAFDEQAMIAGRLTVFQRAKETTLQTITFTFQVI